MALFLYVIFQLSHPTDTVPYGECGFIFTILELTPYTLVLPMATHSQVVRFNKNFGLVFIPPTL